MKFLKVLVLILLPLSVFPQLVGKVVSVADGDTFTMLVKGNERVKVRLHGIDCPEKGQDYSDVARNHIAALLRLSKDSVKVDVKNKDRYGRTIGIAYAGRTNFNESLLEHGLAWHYKQYDKNPKWALMEEGARHARFNLWSLPNPVPPWEWRKKKRMKK